MGPGFDCVGMSIHLYNEVIVETSNDLIIKIPVNPNNIPSDESNLIIQAMKMTYDYANHAFIPAKLTQINNIPLARGLGSSSACIVAGIMIANHLMGDMLSFDQRLEIAVDMDGHPDNVLPTLSGGLTGATITDGKVHYVQLMPHDKFTFVFIIPDFELNTKEARKVFPETFSKQDTITNLCNSVVLTHSLVLGLTDNIRPSIGDTIHQPYRKAMIPHYDDIEALAYDLGADGFYLSGAGPTLACIVSDNVNNFLKKIEPKLKSLGSYSIIVSKPSKEGAKIL